jgi:hypothetical protein
MFRSISSPICVAIIDDHCFFEEAVNQMRIALYTSFAINYLAKARVLAKSVKAVNHSIDIIAIVCDRFPSSIDATSEPFDQVWMVDEYPADPVKAWIFRHNIMELCTAVKGWGLRRLLESGYDYVLYLDPDCWVLADPQEIIRILKVGMSVLVVPHTTSPAETKEAIRLIEISSLKHGIYNLGFLLVKNDENGRRFAKWWADRLHYFCFADFENGMFTDQRWFDLAVGYFPFIQVTWHKGIDVASWNIGQRSVARALSGGYLIDGDPLIFYHFSGVGPAGVHRWVRDIFAASDPLAAELEFNYEALINAAGQRELSSVLPAYDRYSDGSTVKTSDRAMFRKSDENSKLFPDPYRTTTAAPFRNSSDADADRFSCAEIEALALRLFDTEFYRKFARLPSANAAALWTRYKRWGWAKSNRPNRYFDPAFYAASIPRKERRAYVTPLHHFVAVGRQRQVMPVWFFDEAYYLKLYPDVDAKVRSGIVVAGIEHFIFTGYVEGRSSSALFDEANYLRTNPDVAEAVSSMGFLNGGEHYIRFGHMEGRRGVDGIT